MSARTMLAGVMGHPIAHSVSPAMHTAALRHDGIDAVYLAFDVHEAAFEAAVEGLRVLGCKGVNVTLPFKARAASLAQVRSGEVDACAAANTIVFGDRVRAYNTDVHGVVEGLRELGAPLPGAVVAVLGAGGAARGSVLAAVQAGAARVLVANRTLERAREVAASAPGNVDVVGWADRGEAAAEADVVINATSMGMDGSATPLDADALRLARRERCRVVLDLVYGRDPTPLVRDASAAGLVAGDGLSVLVHQGAQAYSLIWGRPAPLQVMRDAAEAAIRHRTAHPRTQHDTQR